MKRIVFCLAVVIVIAGCNSGSKRVEKVQPKEIALDSVGVKLQLPKDTTITLTLNKERVLEQNGKYKSSNATSTVVAKICKGENNGWKCFWTIQKVKIPNNEFEGKIEKIYEGLTYNVSLDSNGTFVSLNNWPEVKSKGLHALSLLLNELRLPQPDAAFISQNVGSLFSSKEAIETYLIQDVQLYFGLSGLHVSKKDTLSQYAISMHPLSGTPIIQQVETMLKKGYSNSTCDIVRLQTINKEMLKRSITESFNKIAEKTSSTSNAEQEDELNNIDVSISSNYNVSFKSGLVNKVKSVKKIRVNNGLRTDNLEIVKM